MYRRRHKLAMPNIPEEGIKINYNDLERNRQYWKIGEIIIIPREFLELAIYSGAVFGKENSEGIRNMEEMFKGQMFHAQNASFVRFCEILAERSDKVKKIPMEKYAKFSSQISRRDGNFARAVFNAILNKEVNYMDSPYLR